MKKINYLPYALILRERLIAANNKLLEYQNFKTYLENSLLEKTGSEGLSEYEQRIIIWCAERFYLEIY